MGEAGETGGETRVGETVGETGVREAGGGVVRTSTSESSPSPTSATRHQPPEPLSNNLQNRYRLVKLLVKRLTIVMVKLPLWSFG